MKTLKRTTFALIIVLNLIEFFIQDLDRIAIEWYLLALICSIITAIAHFFPKAHYHFDERVFYETSIFRMKLYAMIVFMVNIFTLWFYTDIYTLSDLQLVRGGFYFFSLVYSLAVYIDSTRLDIAETD